MRIMAHKFFLAPVLLAAAAFTTTTAQAERVNVPFSFSVDGHNMLPGTYTVERDSSLGMVSLKSPDGAKVYSWVLGPGDAAPGSTKVALKFDTHTLALHSIQYGAQTTSRLDHGGKSKAFEPARLSQGR
ncbi:MAG TPA: hypothetical protein VGG85_03775 [Terracidiphilus sp.]|jgi:hypothetical protein